MIINIDQLEQLLETMQPRQRLYEIIKKELKRRGRWKNLPRGKAPDPKHRYGTKDKHHGKS
jgi:hypothetical protein